MTNENVNYLDLVKEQNACCEITYYISLMCKVIILTKHKIKIETLKRNI